MWVVGRGISLGIVRCMGIGMGLRMGMGVLVLAGVGVGVSRRLRRLGWRRWGVEGTRC